MKKSFQIFRIVREHLTQEESHPFLGRRTKNVGLEVLRFVKEFDTEEECIEYISIKTTFVDRKGYKYTILPVYTISK